MSAEQLARELAADLIAGEEGCHLHAYPDPRSPMGVALGQRGIDEVGRTGRVPASVAQLAGDPWTIGRGATGPDIVRGTVWSIQHADARFIADLASYHNKAERAWPGMRTLHPAAQGRVRLVPLVLLAGLALLALLLRDPLAWLLGL